jgi:hypothetical protein
MEMASERKRNGGIEAPAWWVQMAKAERLRAGKRVEDLAADVSALLRRSARRRARSISIRLRNSAS